MAIGTYSELVTAASNWMARSDLIDRIPEFIALCEAKLNRVLFVPQMEQRATTNVDTTSDEPEFITLPSDFQTMRRVRLGGVIGKPRLSMLTHTQMDDYRYSIDDVSDQPIYFSIVGTEMELAPTPNENYELEMVYRKTIPALSNVTTTNWLLTLAPDVYLYGTLREAGIFTQEDERVPLWTAGYEAAVDALNKFGERQEYSAGPSTIFLPGVVP